MNVRTVACIPGYRLLREIREEYDQGSGYVSSDEEPPTNQITDASVITEEDYRDMLRTHRKRRKTKVVLTCNVATCVYK